MAFSGVLVMTLCFISCRVFIGYDFDCSGLLLGSPNIEVVPKMEVLTYIS